MTLEVEDVARVLDEAGLPGPFTLTALRGGGNNRVYRIDRDGEPVLLKAYFQHPDDPRDRLGAEFSFCRYAWDAGLRCVPRPLACDRKRGLGAYEFIPGRTVSSTEVTSDFVQQAAEFYCQLNRHRSVPAARELRNGSEACFSLAQHLRCVDGRMGRFGALDRSTPTGEEAHALVETQLFPRWAKIRGSVLSQAVAWGPGPDEELHDEDRRLSPSDFGFHNSIASDEGRLAFIDFEYAGWDDPAKTVCDFFCQPDVRVPPAYFDRVVDAFTSDLSHPPEHVRRISLLLPVYRVKWCCIMLNDFLPVGSRRRSFARDSDEQEERLRLQLQKVHSALEKLDD